MSTIPANMKYEDALAQLQDILNELEKKEVSVDELTKKVATAKKLVDFCQTKLTKTEKEIAKIIAV